MSSTRFPSFAASKSCPLNDGFAVLDQLLAALTSAGDLAGLDAALDFRLLLAEPTVTVDAVLEEFFRLRGRLGEQHYLLCYRLRRWLEGQCVAWVSLDRSQPARRIAVCLDMNTLPALRERCAALAADGMACPVWSKVQFAPVSQGEAVPA